MAGVPTPLTMDAPDQQPPSQKERKRLLIVVEILDKMSALAVAGLGLVAALAWNDAIRLLFTVYFPKPSESISAQFLYAVIITVIVVLVTMYLARLTRRIKERLDR